MINAAASRTRKTIGKWTSCGCSCWAGFVHSCEKGSASFRITSGTRRRLAGGNQPLHPLVELLRVVIAVERVQNLAVRADEDGRRDTFEAVAPRHLFIGDADRVGNGHLFHEG